MICDPPEDLSAFDAQAGNWLRWAGMRMTVWPFNSRYTIYEYRYTEFRLSLHSSIVFAILE